MKKRLLALLLCAVMLFTIIPAAAAENVPADDNGLVLDKYVTKDEDGNQWLVLETYTTGRVTEGTAKPADIVLVLDTSASMIYNDNRSWYNTFATYVKDTKDSSLFVAAPNECFASDGLMAYDNAPVAATDPSDPMVDDANDTYFFYKNADGVYKRVYWCDICHNAHTHFETLGYGAYALVAEPCATCQIYGKAPASYTGTSFFTEKAPGSELYPCQCYKWSTSAHGHDAPAIDVDSNVHYNNVADQSAKVNKNTDTVYLLARRMEVMQHVVENFINTVAANAPDNNIAIVEFNLDASVVTEMKPATDPSLITTIRGIHNYWSGGTNPGSGLALVNDLFANTEEGRDKIVVLLTDGQPATYGSWQGSSEHPNIVADGIKQAAALKGENGDDVTIYAVSIYENSNSVTMADPVDYYLNYISSNYPKAKWDDSVTIVDGDAEDWKKAVVAGEKGEKGDYYMSADSVSGLSAIFSDIAENTGASSINLGAASVVKDYMTQYFDGPNADQVVARTYDCLSYKEATGEVTWSTEFTDIWSEDTVKVDLEKGNVEVTGFDFNDNYIAEIGRNHAGFGENEFHGRKLVVAFPLLPKEDSPFLGGAVPTNKDASGVYDSDGKLVEEYDVPSVELPVKELAPTIADQHIYLSTEADLSKLPGAVDSRIDGNNNAGVDISYTVKDSNGNIVATLDIPAGVKPGAWVFAEGVDTTPALTDDARYTIEAEIVSVTDEENTDSAIGATPSFIYVYKPDATFADLTAGYGDTVSYADGDIKWLHPEQGEADEAKMLTAEPELTLTFDPADGIVDQKKDYHVNVTVMAGENDLTADTTFHHADCDVKDCAFDAEKGEFLVHVKTGALTITKVGGEAGEPYVFDIYKDGKFYTQTTIIGNECVTISELPMGTYTVKEDAGWAWRYEVDNGGSAKLDLQNLIGSITCTNSNRNEDWLNSFSSVVKNIFTAKNVAE